MMNDGDRSGILNDLEEGRTPFPLRKNSKETKNKIPPKYLNASRFGESCGKLLMV